MTAAAGFDYSGKIAYYAVVDKVSVKTSGSLEMPSTADPTELLGFFNKLEDLIETLDDEYHLPYIWIEQPWVNGMKFPKSGMMLMRMATFLEIAALEATTPPVTVHPGTWRKKVFGNGRPADTKKAALAYCENVLEYEVPTFGKTARAKAKDHNFADAACIAQYGYLMQQEHEAFTAQGAELWKLDDLRTG